MDISNDPDALRSLLEKSTRIAVVGCSPKPGRDSHEIAKYLLEAGYDMVPVNPGQARILDRPCYPTLNDVPGAIDIVDIFRSPEHVPPIVEEAITVGAKAVWMQLGVGNPEAAKRASDAGLTVIVERCIMVVHRQLKASRAS